MRRPPGGRVVVFDSNALNPYGAELAAVLDSAGYTVTRWCRVGDPFEGRVARRRVLWASRQQVGLFRAVLSRHWGTMLFGLETVIRRNAFVIFTWPMTRLELRVMLLLVALKVPIAYLDHNPLASRPLPPAKERLLDRLRSSAAVRVVHSDALADHISPRPWVASHPSYRRWVREWSASSYGDSRRALFLGALRPDKGSQQLPAIIRSLLARSISVLVAGRGRLPGPAIDDHRVTFVGGDRSLSDEEVAAAIRKSSVLIAPYRDVTMSGTIVMALTAGLPVVAYDAPVLRNLLPNDFLVTSGDVSEFVDQAVKLVEAKLEWVDELASLPDRLDAACADSWRRILQSV